MLTTIQAIVEAGQIKLLESVDLLEGQKLLVTILSEDESKFWLDTSQDLLDTVWDNAEDDIYAQLLEE
jgi:predicted DNA-binding antitoxin AbrB/MazE fold protein